MSKRRKIPLNQEIVTEIFRELKLTRCPSCSGTLQLTDNHKSTLGYKNTGLEDGEQSRYCPKEDYWLELESHQYRGNTHGTELTLEVSTNSKNSSLLARLYRNRKNEFVRVDAY
ncbi:hypothetical protein HN832_00410 [archaeon]|jgi:hypothetical protein|nr:hypothetical protein [archaeon]MBT4373706.1 hypothetical protein [archaeon]MBT4531760.1 hypothetical protein [archaeon]MBT7001872.1 hypothetical protein [archaeon]MBT7281857.1 hypothetical protein [archaeon]